MAARKPAKKVVRRKPVSRPVSAYVVPGDEDRTPPAPQANPLQYVVDQLREDLERVNRTLITRNDQLDAAKAVAEREIFKDVVVLAAILDAKAYISTRGGMEGAVIIQRMTNVESRLGAQATLAAVVLQKVKAMAASHQAGHEVFAEDIDALLTSGEKLL